MIGVSDEVDDRSRAITMLGIAAAASVAAMLGLRIALNSPLGVPTAVARSYAVFETASLVVPAMTALVLGVLAVDLREQIGLVSIGVFGMLAVASPTVEASAAGVIVAGGAIVAASRIGRPRDWKTVRRAVIVAAILASIAVTIGTTIGPLSTPLRSTGTVLALSGMAISPVLLATSPDRVAWIGGGLVMAGVISVGATAPFIAGAVALVGGAIVGAPLLLVALGVGGASVTILGALANEQPYQAIGGMLLLTGGVPATVPRALAVTLGIVFLLGGPTVEQPSTTVSGAPPTSEPTPDSKANANADLRSRSEHP